MVLDVGILKDAFSIEYCTNYQSYILEAEREKLKEESK